MSRDFHRLISFIKLKTIKKNHFFIKVKVSDLILKIDPIKLKTNKNGEAKNKGRANRSPWTIIWHNDQVREITSCTSRFSSFQSFIKLNS